MPYRLDWEPLGVVRRYTGHLTRAERRESLEAICADPRFDALRWTITDFTGISHFDTDDENTLETAALHVGPLRTNPRITMIAVTTRPDVLAAIEDFRALAFTNADYLVFATLDEARRQARRIERAD